MTSGTLGTEDLTMAAPERTAYSDSREDGSDMQTVNKELREDIGIRHPQIRKKYFHKKIFPFVLKIYV